jgi:hypothetical protein
MPQNVVAVLVFLQSQDILKLKSVVGSNSNKTENILKYSNFINQVCISTYTPDFTAKIFKKKQLTKQRSKKNSIFSSERGMDDSSESMKTNEITCNLQTRFN